MPNEIFTRKQAADILLVQPRTLKKYEKQGILSPSFYLNGRPRYTLADLEKLIRAKGKELIEEKTVVNI